MNTSEWDLESQKESGYLCISIFYLNVCIFIRIENLNDLFSKEFTEKSCWRIYMHISGIIVNSINYAYFNILCGKVEKSN